MLADKIRSVAEAEGLREREGREHSWAGLGDDAPGKEWAVGSVSVAVDHSLPWEEKMLEVVIPRPCARSFSPPPRAARADTWLSVQLPKLNQTLWASYSNVPQA